MNKETLELARGVLSGNRSSISKASSLRIF